MDQMTIFEMDYKYIIDTSSVLTQKPNEVHRKTVYKSQWENIEELIKLNKIVMCSEVFDEIQDEDVKKWLVANECTIIEIDEEIQKNVIKILSEHPTMIKISDKGSSSGDPFLIATAMKYGLSIITEEKKTSPNKIPQIALSYGITSYNITELCENEGWQF